MTAHSLSDERPEIDDAADAVVNDAADEGVGDQMFDLGGDERRMHVRAYNHWVSLLKGRPYPAIDDLDPASIADFGPNSVLLDFSAGLDDPRIAWLGAALRQECGLDGAPTHVADVPSRSLLSRLTDHYLQIIANRAPIGFEAEFVSTRSTPTLYRGILMPFSSDGDCIDFIYGVINWKEMADAATKAGIAAELAAARAAPPAVEAPVWADGPAADHDAAADTGGRTLADQLAMARESAAAVRAADTRSRAALYRALGRAHDFALAADADGDTYLDLLAQSGIRVQARAPMTPMVKLVFGPDYDKTRLTEFAAVLDNARRNAVAPGALPQFLELHRGGIKAVVAAERAARRPQATVDVYEQARAELRARPVLAQVTLKDLEPMTGGEFVLLVARRDGEELSVVAQVGGALVDQVIRKAAA
ncbi:PAS domain-containing protein [Sphingomonas sp.]|uniref:PAS domain-containing protein n=1 Tax=Sphingomonas sp. TaxID=28214 RepID=UPI003CC5C98C